MRKRIAFGLLITALLAWTTNPALAQRGRPGGGGGGGGGMQRPMGGMSRPSMPSGGGGGARPGGGMARPAPQQMARPSMPNRPSMGNMGNMSRPNMPMQNRPAGMTRPSMPNQGMVNRPNPGAMTRPSMPGGLGGGGNFNRPGMANRPGQINRPSVMPGVNGGFPGGNTRPSPGFAGGLRPGQGGPSTLPGQIGNRPGMGNRPGFENRPGLGNRPGPGGVSTLPGQIGNRPSTLPGQIGNRPGGVTTLPGQIGNRPGGGLNRPGGGIGDINRPGLGNRPGIGNRPGTGNGITPLPGQIGNRPNLPGGIYRPGQGGPSTLPGQIGNRPGWGNGNRPGGGIGSGGIGSGNRPPWGDRPTNKLPPGWTGNRPGGGGWGGNGGSGGGGIAKPPGGRPDWNGNNRPGGWGNRPGGWGNGGNGNNIINNNNNNNNNVVINRPGWGGGNNWGNGNWGGGNWGGNGNWGGGNWGGGNWNNNWGGGNWGGGGGWYGGGGNVVNNYYGPGWSGANYGNWYQGSNNFWAGVGTGLVTSWGLNSLFYPSYAYSAYNAYPSAWSAPVYGSWGLNSIASDWMYSSYANPYITPATQTVYVQQPQAVIVQADGTTQAPVTEQVVAYDYSKPINTTSPPPEPTAAESAQKVFESAREAFKQNDYGRALTLADQALTQLQTDPVLHEFRALCLFALKRYDEAAAVNYAVLSAGPSWDWATMINLYSGIDVYTGQLRELESYVKLKPDSAPAQFQLAFLYLSQGAKEAAAAQFEKVAQLQPADTLSAQLAKTLDPSPERQKIQQTLTAEQPTAQPPATTGTDVPAPSGESEAAPPPPPKKLVGTWTASPDTKVKITLVLKEDGAFSWAVTQDGRTQTIQGQAGYQDDVLILGQQEGPPLAGKVIFNEEKKEFSFKPPGSADNVTGLTFVPESTQS